MGEPGRMTTSRTVSKDQINEAAERATFNGFIPIDELAAIIAEDECYSDVLPTLWKFYECDIKYKENE